MSVNAEMVLSNILTQLETLLRLNTISLKKQTEESQRLYEQYISEFDKAFLNICQNKSKKDYTYVYEIEIAIAKLSGIYRKGRTILDYYLFDKKSNFMDITKLKKDYYEVSMTSIESIITTLSGLIDITTYNNIQCLNISKYNYFGLDRSFYIAYLQNTQYKSTFEIQDKTCLYEFFTGDRIISKSYKKSKEFTLGVVNTCNPTTYVYRIHRLICILTRLKRYDLVSVLTRFILNQITLEDLV